MLLGHSHASSKKGGKGQTKMLKQIEIKVSLCKKSGMHKPIKLKKDGFTAKNIEFAESNLLSVLEAEVKQSNIVDQHDI